ncbi:MAG: cysteine peptidase family C39 domain-containing protein [Verrucomicrobiota bacterium]
MTCEYSDLVRKQSDEAASGPCSAATLAHLAATSGLPLQPVSLTMAELRACAKPAIVHMDGETPEAGAFLLMLSISDKQIYFVDGPSASMNSMASEDFRRVWSGIVLLPATNRKKDVVFCAIGFSAGLILPLVIQFARSKRSS